MPIMIPPEISDDAPVSEKIVFETLKILPQSRDWIVLHGREIPIEAQNTKDNPTSHKIDFVILIPEYFSVICLEVEEEYYNFNFDADRWASPSGEFALDKAQGAMEALQNRFKNPHFRNDSPLSLGCAVVFTDGTKITNSETPQHLDSMFKTIGLPNRLTVTTQEAREFEDALNPTYAASRIDALEPYTLFQVLEGYAKEHLDSRTDDWGAKPERNQNERNQLIELDNLRNDLVSLGGIIAAIATIFHDNLETHVPQLLHLTDDQLSCLRVMGYEPPIVATESNNQPAVLEPVEVKPRCVINGAAGTGKTVLALEIARERCTAGQTVALLCSNPYLNRRFVKWANKLSDNARGRVVAGTPAEIGSDISFNYLIVDEAQNLCDNKSLELMDRLLEKGLAKGSWAMFGDFTYQNIISPNPTQDGRDILKSYCSDWYPIELQINCRNTYEIAAAVTMFADIKESAPKPGVHGPLIQTLFFEKEEELVNLLDRLVRDLNARKFHSRQIILLSSGSDEFNTASEDEYGGWKLHDIRNEDGDESDTSSEADPKKLRYSDIIDFQGLESEVVILVIPLTKGHVVVEGGATHREYERLRRVLYTGMSRARAMLIIVAHNSYMEDLEINPLHEPTYEDYRKSTAQLALKG